MIKNVDKAGRIKINWAAVIFGTIAVLTVIPVIAASGYSVYSADDFSHARGVGVFGGDVWELFAASLRYAKQMYLTWQGTYTSMFLQAFLSPLNGLGDIQLCAVMVFNAVLFIASLKMFISAVCKSLHMDIDVGRIWLFFSICVVGIFAFKSWTEVFYWFSGAVSYSFPMSFALLGVAIMLRSKSYRSGCIGALLMFLASGGTLAVAGAGCFVLLGICIVKKMGNNVTIRDYIILGVAVCGALINAAAPGNYVRHAIIDDTGLHFGTAMIASVLEVFRCLENLILNTPFSLIVLAALIAGAGIGSNNEWNEWKKSGKLAVVAAICAVAPFVVCFPVCLGYNGGTYFPNRCEFVEISVLVISLVNLAIIAGGGYLASLAVKRKREILTITAIFIIVMPNVNPSWKITQSMPYLMWKDLSYGRYKEYYNDVKAMYEFIDNDTNDNVFLPEMPKAIEHFSSVAISEDMSNWINNAIAAYYHKNSLQYVSSPLYVQADGQKNIRISPKTFGDRTGYASIFKLDNATQTEEALWVLQPFDSNMVISMGKEETGKVAIYLFADRDGNEQIDSLEVNY